MKRKNISAFDAKTHLSQLLRETEAGYTYVIHRHGKPVARLSPAEPEVKNCDFKSLAASFRKVRKNIKGAVKVRRLIEEGRRH